MWRGSSLSGPGRLTGFDVSFDGSVVLKATINLPYSDGEDFGSSIGLQYGVLLVSRHGLSNWEVTLLPPEQQMNFAALSVVSIQGSSLWLDAWDWETGDMINGRPNPGRWIRSAKYSMEGAFTGVLSREQPGYPDSSTYRSTSDQWLCDGLDTTTMVRVIEGHRAVDLVNTRDGTFRRVPLPSTVPATPDSGKTYTTHAVRFGKDLLGVKVMLKDARGTSSSQFVAIGRLEPEGRHVTWLQVLDLSAISDDMLALVDTHENPQYQSGLYAIMESRDQGPYLAKIRWE
ncbi:MAG: hypothetical protein FGM32_10000 [Candidatus Kapabacteria bacterium]|nr:hypothetical protein [Candidatus Kapabacteria bacterium]